ncbi:MAG: hypothetical protein ACUVSF_09625 [Anaerolineae bacterium]
MPATYNDNLVLRASEVGHYLFCRRAWWLARVLGYCPDDRAALMAGVQFHEQIGRSISAAQCWQNISYALLGLGVVVGILLILSSCGAVIR